MPHFVNRQAIPLATRARHLDRVRKQLRATLMNPALSPEQRDRIKLLLSEIGKPKVYRPDSPPPLGAIDPSTGARPEPVILSGASLGRLPKTDVYTIGRSEGCPLTMDMTKPQMIEAILARR